MNQRSIATTAGTTLQIILDSDTFFTLQLINTWTKLWHIFYSRLNPWTTKEHVNFVAGEKVFFLCKKHFI